MQNVSSHTEASAPAAEISGLHLQFPRQVARLFRNLSLKIRRNENTLLLGPSGSGKSTLLKVLTGLIPEVIEMPLRCEHCSTFDNWGYVFQDPDSQFCMPFVDEEIAFVLENRALPTEDMPEFILHYLNLVGLEFDEPHRPIETLSQGQKQRLALASALALEPETLVLDEPTALLDPGGTEMIWEKVRGLSEDKTLLIVEHKIEEMIDFIDRVLVLDDQGQLIIDASPDQISQKHQYLLDQYGIWHTRSWPNYDSKRSNRLKLSENSTDNKNPQPVLKIDHLEGYRDETKLLEMPALDIYPGEWIALTGPNGAGKSTLLLALMQLIDQKGDVLFCGENVESTEQVAADIGFVFQNPELQFVAQSAREEVIFTLHQQCPEINGSEVPRRSRETLKQYGLHKVAAQNPYQLSTGQQRRLSIAATTVKKRKLLLLDEPTFGQDAVNTFAILEQLEKYRQSGTAILMATHDLAIVQRFATRWWKIADGKLKFDRPGQRLENSRTEDIHAI